MYRQFAAKLEKFFAPAPPIRLKLLAVIGLCYACALQAQQPSSAIEKQRASVRRQLRAEGPAAGFFMTPWINSTAAPLAASPSFGLSSNSSASGGDCEPMPEAALSKLILEAAQREHVDTRVIRAMVRRESGAKPCAVSPKGAQGLMQLMPGTQIELGVQDPFDAESNLNAGVRYFKQMLDRYSGNVALALAAYNAGPQRVSPRGKIPDIPETQSYVMSIMGQLNEEEPSEVK
jgi:soluble lytic murein transglycosylase-like protein